MSDIVTLNGYKIKDEKAVRSYETVALMKADTKLKEGYHVKTKGYYEANDGGEAEYKIVSIESESKHQEQLNNELYAELIFNKEINTKQFGIVGDGETDESELLQEFFNTEADVYIINSENILIDDDIDIPSNSIINFINNSKITRKATNKNTYFMLNMINKYNITINNCHLIGDRDTHTGETGEWGYGIHIAYSHDITINNSIIEKTWGDGIYIGTSFVQEKVYNTYNILCNNCNILNCSRNGISICTGKNIKLLNCSASSIDRISPKAGIDVEIEFPEGTEETIEDVLIDNFKSNNCDYGIQVHNTKGICKNVIINNHQSFEDKNGSAYYLANYNSNVIYKNSTISKYTEKGIYILTVDTSKNCNLLIQNVTFDSTTIETNNAIFILGSADYTTGNITVDNITILNSYNLYIPNFAFDMYWYTGEDQNFSNIVLKNIYDNGISDKKRFYIYNKVIGNVNFGNCIIERTVSGTYYLANNYMNKITTDPNTTNTLVILPELLDGDYEFYYNGNTSSADHIIQFSNDVIVYNGNTQVHDGSGNYYIHITSVCCKLKFIKNNNIINIVEHNGFTL